MNTHIHPHRTTKVQKLRWHNQKISVLPGKKFKNCEVENTYLMNSPLFIHHSVSPLCVPHPHLHTHIVRSCSQPCTWPAPSVILTGSWQECIQIPDFSLPIKTYPACAPLPQDCSAYRGDQTERSIWKPLQRTHAFTPTRECHGSVAWLRQRCMSSAGSQEIILMAWKVSFKFQEQTREGTF